MNVLETKLDAHACYVLYMESVNQTVGRILFLSKSSLSRANCNFCQHKDNYFLKTNFPSQVMNEREALATQRIWPLGERLMSLR